MVIGATRLKKAVEENVEYLRVVQHNLSQPVLLQVLAKIEAPR